MFGEWQPQESHRTLRYEPLFILKHVLTIAGGILKVSFRAILKHVDDIGRLQYYTTKISTSHVLLICYCKPSNFE